MAITRNGFINSALIGGATGALDAKLSTDIVGVAFAITVASGKVYLHYYDSTSASAESSPDVIKPDNLGVGDAGRWLLLDVWTGLAALDAIGALTPAANKLPYFTSASAAANADLTAAARTLLALTAAQGDIPYASATNVISMLAKGAANLKMFMNAGATAPEWAKGLKVGTFTYNMNEASGNKAITGVGFKGGALICFASIQDTPYAWSAGFSDGATHGSIVKQVQATVVMQVSGVLINIGKTSGESQTAVLSSFDADGFTLAFTKTGAYAGADAMTVKWFVLR